MTFRDFPDYPWDSLTPFAEKARSHERGLIDLSVGSPVDETPALIRDALASATDAHSYPLTIGTRDLRETIVAWFERRRGVSGLSVENVLPTVGSKELVALLPLLLGVGERDAVVHPRAAYPTYAVGARIAGATPVACDDPAQWPENTRLVWINSPGNPDGQVAGVDRLREIVARARELGAVVASDECYAAFGWESPWDREAIPSLLDPRVVEGDRRNMLALYSLSKESNLAGYRAAFVAGCRALIAQLTTARKHAGLMVPAPVQAAMVAALNDDEHVAVQCARYSRRRDILKPALEAAGFRIDHSEAGLYLWGSEGRDAWETIDRLAHCGILAGPGSFYGDYSRDHVRFALTASDDQIGEAARRLAQFGEER